MDVWLEYERKKKREGWECRGFKYPLVPKVDSHTWNMNVDAHVTYGDE